VTFGLFLYEIRQIAECIRLRHQAAGRAGGLLPWALIAAAVAALLGKAVQIVVRDRVWACQEPVLKRLVEGQSRPAEIARAIGRPERTVRATLRLLAERRLIERDSDDVRDVIERAAGPRSAEGEAQWNGGSPKTSRMR
jgi:hypothetical protein